MQSKYITFYNGRCRLNYNITRVPWGCIKRSIEAPIHVRASMGRKKIY
jgi:hypothetical protein